MLEERQLELRDRSGPLAGVAAVVLWVIGFILFEAAGVSTSDTGEEILAAYEGDEATIIAAGWLFMLGGLLFLWFLGTLRTRLLAAEGLPGHLTSIAFGAGVAAAIFLIALPSGDLAAATADNLEPAAAVALSNLSTAFFVGAEVSAILLLVATALLALRGALPRWLAWVNLALSVILVIPLIGWLGVVLGLPIWVLLVSWLLWRPTPAGEPRSAGDVEALRR